MDNEQLLQAISNMMDEKLKKELEPIKNEISGIKDDIAQIKEDTEVTRTATNEIIDWIDFFFPDFKFPVEKEII